MSNKWVNTTVGELIQFEGGSQPPRDTFIFEPKEGYTRLLQIRDYKTNKFKTYIPTDLARKFCDETDVMIGRYGPPIFQILRGLSGAYNVALIKAIPENEKVLKNYIYYFLKQDALFKLIDSLSQRTSGQTGIDMEALKSYPFLLPPKSEQKKIVSILSSIDAAIEKTETIIKKTEEVKKGLMQQLLTKGIGHSRFKKTEVGEIPEEWVVIEIGQIAREVKEKNLTNDDVTVLSVTKYDGIVSSLEYFKKQVFSKDTSGYKKIYRNQFAYATIHLDEGSIGILDKYDVGVVSPMYTVFETKENINNTFLLYLLKSDKYINRYQKLGQGSVDRRMSIPFKTLAKLKIQLPNKEEQNEIVKIVKSIDRKINSELKKLDKLYMVKKGLMQSLLTGKVRVKVEETEVTQV